MHIYELVIADELEGFHTETLGSFVVRISELNTFVNSAPEKEGEKGVVRLTEFENSKSIKLKISSNVFGEYYKAR